MKKIMFNDLMHLTDAVIQLRKIQTRRDELNPDKKHSEEEWLFIYRLENIDLSCERIVFDGVNIFSIVDEIGSCLSHFKTRYSVGEIVAVAQSYRDATEQGLTINSDIILSAGWTNKMFVRADLMPVQIKFTGIRLERLQDISDDDCLLEGVINTHNTTCNSEYHFNYYWYLGVTIKNCPYGQYKEYDTPKEAFSHLIDEVSGRETWERNPWVVVYEFERIK